MQQYNRRRFLYLAGGIAGVTGASLRGLAAAGGEDAAGQDGAAPLGSVSALKATTRKSWALGAKVAITALHRDRSVARVALDAAFAQLRRVERLMSIYRPDSQLQRLNRDHVLEDPDPWLVEVLRVALDMSQRSGGAFDVTVQPLWQVYQAAKAAGRLPDPAEIEAARAKVNWRQLRLGDDRVRLRGEASAITLNGIAQGYAADRAMEALRAHGVRNALIDTGEIAALGRKAEGPWTVGIQHPRHDDALLAVARLDGRCLATSGDYATTFSDDRLYNHLFDPRTGRSPTELSSVSIAAPSGMLADALSTAVIVSGPDKGIKLIRAMPNADALLVLKSGRTLATAGFPLTIQ